MDNDLLTYCVSILIVMAAIGISMTRASALEIRLKARLPETRPYKWGFFVGCLSIAFAILPLFIIITVVIVAFATSNPINSEFFPFALFVLHGICGFFIIKRKRWAWIVSIIFSFNPLVWIVNGIYAGRRWREFAEEAKSSTSTPPQSSLSGGVKSLPLPTDSFGYDMYFIAVRGQQQGPYTFNQISTMWNSGQLPADALYWLRGMTTWYPLIDIIEPKKI